MSDFTDSIDANLEGIEFFSVGPCPSCEECGPFDPDDNAAYDLASEGGFSWSSCDSCGSTFGGDRSPAHGYIGEDLHHFSVCVDCLMFHANGDEPEEWRQHPGH